MHISHELIIEILLRLPVKTLLRCRCVCKSWLSLISDPNFATSHFQLCASRTHRLLYLTSYPNQTLTIDFHASLNHDSAYSSLSLDFWRHRYCREIGGSCRGFLFLHCYKDFYLWNPSTGIHKQIPASPISNSSYENIFTFIYGFAYDSSTDDYLVVLGSFKHDGDWEPVSSSIDLEIFSVRANKWKQIMSDSHLPYMRTCQLESGIERVGLFLNGALHWLVWNHETGDDVILAFDVKEMRMSEIALPDDFYISVSPTEHDLMVHGGLICVWMIDIDVVKIWVMKEYTVHSSWTKIIEFSTHHEPYFLICFTNCGDIVGSDFQGALLKFNDKGQMLEHHSYDHHRRYPQRSQMAMYTESLLSLPGGTEQA